MLARLQRDHEYPHLHLHALVNSRTMCEYGTTGSVVVFTSASRPRHVSTAASSGRPRHVSTAAFSAPPPSSPAPVPAAPRADARARAGARSADQCKSPPVCASFFRSPQAARYSASTHRTFSATWPALVSLARHPPRLALDDDDCFLFRTTSPDVDVACQVGCGACALIVHASDRRPHGISSTPPPNIAQPAPALSEVVLQLRPRMR
ncbi:hypothetical protein MSAN_02403800 [Mycena sanguinolenta]|uniref:Uncharacterized protein n=1 Tax=Mycena sanguinolenta TaxID=230812 RepID=A0A8H7CE59_9AGAR|nr:hypothetical protein MSAN_02403800 [Mycena sanguinolenta]